MIVVDENYIIEVDALNYIPKARVQRKRKKSDELYEDWETIGFYSSLSGAIQGILKYKVANSFIDEEKTLETALNEVRTIYKQFTCMLERVVDDGK